MPSRDAIIELLPRLRRYARALVGDAERADDLVQDCVERALSRWHLWRQPHDLRAWLFTIMHNIHANAVRRIVRGPGFVDLEHAQGAATPPDQIEHIALGEHRIERCVDRRVRGAVGFEPGRERGVRRRRAFDRRRLVAR